MVLDFCFYIDNNLPQNMKKNRQEKFLRELGAN